MCETQGITCGESEDCLMLIENSKDDYLCSEPEHKTINRGKYLLTKLYLVLS